jgi:hypothetical protein
MAAPPKRLGAGYRHPSTERKARSGCGRLRVEGDPCRQEGVWYRSSEISSPKTCADEVGAASEMRQELSSLTGATGGVVLLPCVPCEQPKEEKIPRKEAAATVIQLRVVRFIQALGSGNRWYGESEAAETDMSTANSGSGWNGPEFEKCLSVPYFKTWSSQRLLSFSWTVFCWRRVLRFLKST